MATHASILAWEISMDRGAWWATVHGVAKELDMTEHALGKYILSITFFFKFGFCSESYKVSFSRSLDHMEPFFCLVYR